MLLPLNIEKEPIFRTVLAQKQFLYKMRIKVYAGKNKLEKISHLYGGKLLKEDGDRAI